MRKLVRKRLVQGVKRKPPVLIVKPHNIEERTFETTNIFIMQAFQRGIAEYYHIPSKLAELGRNNGIEVLLNKHPEKTHVFFVDDDSPPVDPLAIEQLMAFNKPVVCGVTPIVRVSKNTIDCMWSAIIKKEDGKPENIGIDELPKEPFKVWRTGGTCLLVRREVLEKIKPPYQMTKFNEKWTGVDLSEDMYFSDKIRDAGYDIWCLPYVKCDHFHYFNMRNIFEIYKQCKQMTK